MASQPAEMHPSNKETGNDLEQKGSNGDIAITSEEYIDYTDDEMKKLVRKIDWRLMPFLWGYAVLSAVDVCFPCLFLAPFGLFLTMIV